MNNSKSTATDNVLKSKLLIRALRRGLEQLKVKGLLHNEGGGAGEEGKQEGGRQLECSIFTYSGIDRSVSVSSASVLYNLLYSDLTVVHLGW